MKQDLNKNVSAIIVAGGSSTRMGFDKIFAKLGDKSVIEHSICAFLNCDFINDIILVINENTATQLDELIVSMKTDIEIKIVLGGETRKNSVNNGLKKLDQSCDFVAIHDGARPWINPRQIQRVLQEAKKIGAFGAEPGIEPGTSCMLACAARGAGADPKQESYLYAGTFLRV